MASFWNRASAAWGALTGRERKMDTLDLFREVFGTRSTWAGKDITLATAMQVSTALACGRVIAEGLAMLPWKVLRASGRAILPAVEHPLYERLAIAPNPLQTAFEFVETMGLHLAFCGNAYAWITTVSRRIDALYLLEPGWVTVKYKWPEPPTYEVRHPDGQRFTLSASEVWHLRGPAWSAYAGMEFLSLARQALGLSMAIEEGQAGLQSRGVSMPGFLAVEGTLTADQQQKLRGWIEKEHAGSVNAGRPMVLDRASKWVSTAMSNVDAQTLEQRRMQVEEVCRFMRVLPIMVGHADKTATYASSEQMFLAHAMYTLGPWARRLEQSASRRLLTSEERAGGLYTLLNEKALLRMSAREQAEYLSRLVLSGIIVRNEAREKLDLNPLDGLDEPLAPANTFVGNPPGPQESSPPPSGE